ncbi:MAG: GNAT family N-acetyltransferase [Clostridiaceae bacterium]|nr:GNAT family N-acetyltransferase [Clostridiaceae bacterium]
MKNYSGKGYATEALKELFNWCMAVSNVPYLVLTIDCANKASCRVAEKAGFELFEKRTPISHKQPNMISDSYFYYRKYRQAE